MLATLARVARRAAPCDKLLGQGSVGASLHGHLLYWSLTLLVMLEDDAAVLAFMFC